MRISDTERQRTVEELRRHCAAGRLDVDEYASRIEKALGSSTLGELDVLLADLPMIRIADPAGLSTKPPAALPDLRTNAPLGGPWLAARLLVALSAVMAVLVIGVGLAASWTWSALLVAGWLVGVVQTVLVTRGHRRT